MDSSVKKKILKAYFIASLSVAILWLFFSFGPFWQRDVMIYSQQEIPPKWYEYVGYYLGYLFIPSVYGLFSYIPIKRIDKKPGSGRLYFTGALIIGLIFIFIAWISGIFARIDCGNDCVAYIPSYQALRTMTLLTIPPLFIVPVALIVYFFTSSPNKRQ